GVLDENDWAKTLRISNFTQRELDENKPATEKTEVAVLFTKTDLYFGVWCFDSEPGRIIAQKMSWDFDYGTEDDFEMVLDTYADKRNAYFLVINPNGAQYDAQIMDNGRKSNSDWNGVWHVAVTRTDQGWFAEIRIPFSTLKFSPEDEQTWGINFERNIRHKREQVLWQGWSRDAGLQQVNRAGMLEGLKGLTRLRVFEFRPYAIAGIEKERAEQAGTTADAGLDFNYLVSPTARLDFTVNPDFGQVESDHLIVNLTRFSISYPEKRQFFLETQNFFDFSLGRASPYYSRRIGIHQGRETPIIGGGRFLGKMGGSTIGVMVLQTAETDTSPTTNFSLIRWKQNILEQSSIGILAIGSAQKGRFSGTGGFDALFSTSKLFGDKNLEVGGAIAATYTSDREAATGSAHRVFLSYPNDFLEVDASWERVGRNFNPEVGFLSRTSYQVFSTEWQFNPRPKFLPWVRNLEIKPIDINYYIDDITREMQSVYMEFRPLGMALKSGDFFEFNIERNAENLTEDFEIREGFIIPAGRYWTNRAELQIESFEGRPVIVDAAVNWGQFYNGSSTEWEAQLSWKVNRYFGTSIAYQRTDIRLPAGPLAIDEVVGRMSFSVTPKLFGSVFAQWNNDDDDEILINFRITWIPKPGASLYFVLNQFGDTLNPHARIRMNNTVALIKFVWYFNTK
ncbi:MAG: carbohydrate binding family 9 domain-containing protein, partial [Candidatus Aminicenantes bacterium]|nr:carbohydrate binding family 9 domain-containing protein [Candidatus Aminicenantes bacterium]